jgi:hypothetical protein
MISRVLAHGGARNLALLSLALVLGTLATRAKADPVVAPPFTTGGGNVAIDFNGLSANAGNTSIRDYLNAQLSAAGASAQVTSVTGASGDQNYDGEGYVVGPRGPDGRVTSMTLGTTDFGVLHGAGGDRFLINPSGSDRIRMFFTEPIFAVSFDYEIFPNGDVPNGVGVDPSRYPDFTFNAYTTGTDLANRAEHFHVVSVLPGTNGTYPSSPNNVNERAPQLLGSVSFAFAEGVTVLEFIDWPERIGIDNLLLSFSASPPPAAVPTPEPAALVVWSLIAGTGIAVWRRRLKTLRN